MILPIAAITMAQVAAPGLPPMAHPGDWSGTLTLPSRATLRLVVRLRVDDGGIVRGSIDSIDQRVWNTPLDGITMTATTLDFTVPGNGSRYRGRWDAAARGWSGIWSQGDAAFALSLAAGGPPPRAAVAADAWALPSDAEIGDILDRRIAQRPGEAIVVGVIDDHGRRIVARGPAGADTLFEIGSITKVFTALVLADMAARGEVGLDDPAARYLSPGWTLPVRGRAITLLDLATHRSGLPRLPLNMPYVEAGDPYAGYTPAAMRAFLKDWVPDRPPGAQYEYSNLGGALLGQILARRAGTDYETLVRTRITGPLRMRDTQVRSSGAALRNQATPHDEFLRPVAAWDPSVMVAAGGLRSDARDMLTFLAANLGFVPTPLKPAMDAMRIVRAQGDGPDNAMATGWTVAKTPTGPVVTHGGATGGYLANIAFDPLRRRGVVVLANTRAEPGVDDIATHILTGSPLAAVPPPPKPSAMRPAIRLAPDDLDRFVGRYRLPPDQVITVFRSGDRLMIQLIGQQAMPIHPSGPADFFARIVDAELRFHATNGMIDSVTLLQNGAEKVAPRL
ncbi:serine hydrolase [Sphingomonas sp. Leaf25]|uniref:serine hydrolase n=1 Tax=Sphingomonas sp. Leaf25 TaxID=1735692 RepID=UPI0006FD80BB|nr:serine hydrolase [Sphingomonas sp. Leaf25]KQN00347.1 hypothetical protein ASE78_04270 [Sphingomonas sp. Leaf25]